VKKKFSVLICGLGKIGMIYKSKKKNVYYNYSDLFKNSKFFFLKAGVDHIKKKRIKFQKKFQIKTYMNLSSIKKDFFDVIVICVNTKNFNKIYNTIYLNKIKPHVFILEKPGGNDYLKLQKFKNYCKKNNIKVVMNYSRNHNLKLLQFFRDNLPKLGLVKEIQVNYFKGIMNSCSHYISLLLKLNLIKKNIKLLNTNISKKQNDIFGNVKFFSKRKIFINYKKGEEENILFLGKNGTLCYYTESGKIFLSSTKLKKNKIFYVDINLNFILILVKKIITKTVNSKILQNEINTIKILNHISK
jgi:hypothetical protein